MTLSRSSPRADSTMMGTALHSRIRLMTSRPSMSGRPRSRITTSGWRVADAPSASAPVSASKSLYPWLPSAARKKRRMATSSSTRRIVGSGTSRNRGDLREGQGEEEGHAAPGQVVGPDVAAVSLDDGLADGEPQPGAAGGVGRDAIEPLEDAGLFARRQPGTAVGHLDGDRLVGGRGDDADGAVGRGVLDGVVEQVDQDLLDEHVIHEHQG